MLPASGELLWSGCPALPATTHASPPFGLEASPASPYLSKPPTQAAARRSCLKEPATEPLSLLRRGCLRFLNPHSSGTTPHEADSSACVGEKALNVEKEAPSRYSVFATVAPWMAERRAPPRTPATLRFKLAFRSLDSVAPVLPSLVSVSLRFSPTLIRMSLWQPPASQCSLPRTASRALRA